MVYKTRSKPSEQTKGKAIESHSVEEILQSDQESSSDDVKDVTMPSKSKVTSSSKNKPPKVLEIEAPPAETVRQSASRDNPSFASKRVKNHQFPTDNSAKHGNSKTTKRSSRRTRLASTSVDTNVEDPPVENTTRNIVPSDDKIMSKEEVAKQKSPQLQAEKPTPFEEDVVDYELTSEEGEVHDNVSPQFSQGDEHDNNSLTGEPLSQKQLWEERIIREGFERYNSQNSNYKVPLHDDQIKFLKETFLKEAHDKAREDLYNQEGRDDKRSTSPSPLIPTVGGSHQLKGIYNNMYNSRVPPNYHEEKVRKHLRREKDEAEAEADHKKRQRQYVLFLISAR